jgi:hypothetical protein
MISFQIRVNGQLYIAKRMGIRAKYGHNMHTPAPPREDGHG